MKTHIPKTIRKTVITVVILILMFVVGGMAYVLITDQSGAKQAPKAAPANTTDQSAPLPKPVQPAANAPEGVSVTLVTSPVSVGSNSSVTISTNAGSTCTILVTYNGVQSTDSGLTPKTTDAYGNITWTWTVGNSVPLGSWPIKVTCVYHGRSAVALSSLQVTKQ